MKKLKGIARISTFDYGNSRVTIRFKLAGKEWAITNSYYFSSPIIAENQIKKVCDKLGISLDEND
ncbi:MAG: hypothetical protein ABH919_00565 [bacterium]